MRGSKQTEQESGRKGEGTPHRHLVLYKGTNTIMGSSQVDHAHREREREIPTPQAGCAETRHRQDHANIHAVWLTRTM